MEREKLKQALRKYYSVSGTNLILRGERRPSYKVIVELHKHHNIPFDIWLDIRQYIDKKEQNSQSPTDGS